jgi:hypothetical protein
MSSDKIHRPVLTSRECYLIYFIFDKLAEHLCGDTRPDHGLAKLESLRYIFDFSEDHETRKMFHNIMGKMWRMR